ncbi:MAG: ABC transporter permease [Deltaproteobacteria bacterium]|nr:ABC transporter permease [Deltaproteobacteria bacterium]
MLTFSVKTFLRRSTGTILLAGMFIYLILDMNPWKFFLRTLFPEETEWIYPRAMLIDLVGEHLLLVAISSALAVIAGIAAGIFVTRRSGRVYLQTALVAILALAVPFIGFGFKPTIAALFLYSILPVVRNTISGIGAVPAPLIEAAFGMGMTRPQILFKVEIPLAMKVIMAGIRMSVVMNIGTATLGAIVGAGGLGAPIISGLVRQNPAFVLEGALTVCLLAVITDRLIAGIEECSF